MRKTLRTVAIWSVASFGVSTAMFLPGSLQADKPAQNASAVGRPTSISTDHFDLVLTLADPKDAPVNPQVAINIEPGLAPKMTLIATNKTGVVLTVPVNIRMTAMSRASLISRVPLTPREIWHYQRDITLNPGATDNIQLTSDAKLDVGNLVGIQLSAADKTVYPMSFAVKAPSAK